MATFDYTHVVFYFGNGDNAFLFDDRSISGTLSEPDADDEFDAGDVASGGRDGGGILASNLQYLGTTVIDGQTWPVFFNSSTTESSVYMSQAPVSIPGTLQVEENATLSVCFAAGTMIGTPAGDAAVEALGLGDLVLTADGRAVPVTWLGRQTLAPRFSRLRLIRVAAHALGAGLPVRDLTLTADHALLIDGYLINAGALVNGTSIAFVPLSELGDSYTVYHVETERHDVILAEGTPAETYIDYMGRQTFDNYAEYVALYGDARPIIESPLPRITAARHLPAHLQARLGITRAA